jgi:hypothetical protein
MRDVNLKTFPNTPKNVSALSFSEGNGGISSTGTQEIILVSREF